MRHAWYIEDAMHDGDVDAALTFDPSKGCAERTWRYRKQTDRIQRYTRREASKRRCCRVIRPLIRDYELPAYEDRPDPVRLGHLPFDQWAVVTQRSRGLSQKQVAESLGVSTSSVQRREDKARASIRAQFGGVSA